MKPAYRSLLQIRTEPELRAAIESAADRDMTSISEYVRRELRSIVAHRDADRRAAERRGECRA